MLVGSLSSSATQEPDKAGGTPYQPQVPHLQVQVKAVPSQQGFFWDDQALESLADSKGSNMLSLMLLRATGIGPSNIQVIIPITWALLPLID